MDTIPVRYVGNTSTNIDPILSLTWRKSEVKDIDRRNAEFLLYYEGIFVDARGKAARKKDPIIGRERKSSDITRTPDVIHADIGRMSEETLARFALANFNMKRDDTPQAAFRQRVFERMRREAR